MISECCAIIPISVIIPDEKEAASHVEGFQYQNLSIHVKPLDVKSGFT